MKYLKQFGIILIISLIGELLHYVIPAPIPASIYGIIILFLLLVTKALKLEAVSETAHFLINIMSVMFIPAGVKLMEMWGIIAPNIVPYSVIIVSSTLIVFAVAGMTTQAVLKSEKQKNAIPTEDSKKEAEHE